MRLGVGLRLTRHGVHLAARGRPLSVLVVLLRRRRRLLLLLLLLMTWFDHRWIGGSSR